MKALADYSQDSDEEALFKEVALGYLFLGVGKAVEKGFKMWKATRAEDEAVEVLEEGSSVGDEVVEVLDEGARAGDEVIESLDEGVEASNRIAEGADEVADEAAGSINEAGKEAVELADAARALDLDGGHSWADHGAHTTEAQHLTRLQTGLTPGGSTRAAPSTSSKFNSDKIHVQSYEDALTKLETEKINTRGGLKKKVEIKKEPLQNAGISYSLDVNGNLVETTVESYTAVFRLDQSNNTYKLITLFPE